MDEATFIPPSIHHSSLLSGASSTYYSPVPPLLLAPDSNTNSSSSPSNPTETTTTSSSSTTTTTTNNPPPCCLGVDEAGRGPVLGPMVYGVFYLPIPLSDPLLRQTHHFDDSKVLTPAVRSSLMHTLCTPGSDLHSSCGWATTSLSARDIGANMLRPSTYNLNAQAMDTTIDLIRGVFDRGVNVQEIYVDTIGQPATYQAKLQRIFPTTKITVAKKADSLYACVSAASVCAKVTRDAALEQLYKARGESSAEAEWGSGYPSDARCVSWMKRNMHPVFGWGPECRFSWGTAKDMLDGKAGAVKVDWPAEEDESMRLTDYFGGNEREHDELGSWYGCAAGLEAF
ncbi:hypothetical protein E4U55_002357 [Claviceps digitariae]|nr:hypothetical protein E4U55_002357 [Claviceps digitariae]